MVLPSMLFMFLINMAPTLTGTYGKLIDAENIVMWILQKELLERWLRTA